MERSPTHSTHKSQIINNRLQDQYIHQYPFSFILLSLKPLLTIRCITPITDFCLIPIGTPTASVSNEVAAVQRLLKKAKNIQYTMHSAGTTLGKFLNQTIHPIHLDTNPNEHVHFLESREPRKTKRSRHFPIPSKTPLTQTVSY